VGAALQALREDYPAVYDRVVTERREVRPHVNVFVGREDIRWSGGLGTPLTDGSEVVILPSVSGG
jgi:molybdopterin synthase sulfur carrier subunit